MPCLVQVAYTLYTSNSIPPYTPINQKEEKKVLILQRLIDWETFVWKVSIKHTDSAKEIFFSFKYFLNVKGSNFFLNWCHLCFKFLLAIERLLTANQKRACIIIYFDLIKTLTNQKWHTLCSNLYNFEIIFYVN